LHAREKEAELWLSLASKCSAAVAPAALRWDVAGNQLG
jgi:hypothetical protein